MSEFHARSRRRLSGEAGAAAVAPPSAPSDGTERQRERKKPGRKPATSVLCQVAGCGAELLRPGAAAGRDYYSRYRICREHCIAPQLIIDGKPQRFCQQHGRFHDLDKFEPNRRSCIAALSHHRHRRRTFGGKQASRGGKQGGSPDRPAQQPEQSQRLTAVAAAAAAAATVAEAAPPPTPCQSFGCCPSDSEAATPVTPVCFAGDKGSRWQGASFAPQATRCAPQPVAPMLPAAPADLGIPVAAAGISAAHQPAAVGRLGPEAAVAAVPGPLLGEPMLTTSTSEELAERWLEEILFDGAPVDVKSPYEALLESDVW